MLKQRMILCLLMNNDGVFFNSRNFKLQPVGELDWIRRYLNFQAIDELVILNVSRENKSVERFSEHLLKLAKLCFVPISAGGGITTRDHIQFLLDTGADKVVINSQTFANPTFLSEAAAVYGAQCIVSSIDVRRSRDGYQVLDNWGTRHTGFEVLDWARRVEELGAGEIFLTSIDQDGCGSGYDLELVRSVVDAVSIPIIASGGVGEFGHLADGVTMGHAAAVSAANIFHFIGDGLINAKKHIAGQGLNFPMWNFM